MIWCPDANDAQRKDDDKQSVLRTQAVHGQGFMVAERCWYTGVDLQILEPGSHAQPMTAWIDWTMLTVLSERNAREGGGAVSTARDHTLAGTPPAWTIVFVPAAGTCPTLVWARAHHAHDTPTVAQEHPPAFYPVEDKPMVLQVDPAWVGGTKDRSKCPWILLNAMIPPAKNDSPWALRKPWVMVDWAMHLQAYNDLLEQIQVMCSVSGLTEFRLGPSEAVWTAPKGDQKVVDRFIATEAGRQKRTLWFSRPMFAEKDKDMPLSSSSSSSSPVAMTDAKEQDVKEKEKDSPVVPTRRVFVHLFPFRAFADTFSNLSGTCVLGIVPAKDKSKGTYSSTEGSTFLFRFLNSKSRVLMDWMLCAGAVEARVRPQAGAN
jgi:hypothetical protein